MKTIKALFLVSLFIGVAAFTSIPEKGYKVGDKASDFTLKNVDGKMVSLSDYSSAKGFILIFTCNTCPYSVANEDRIIELDKMYKSKGYPVIAVNPNDPRAQKGEELSDMAKRAKEKGFTFPYLLDEGQKVYPVYGATRTPHVYILNKKGSDLIVEYIGAIDDSSRNPATVKEKYVEDALNALLKGEKPSKTYTKAIGCSIKTL